MNMTWSDEIRILGHDFCVSKWIVKDIIKKVSSNYKNKPDDYKYDRAWSMLYKYM